MKWRGVSNRRIIAVYCGIFLVCLAAFLLMSIGGGSGGELRIYIGGELYLSRHVGPNSPAEQIELPTGNILALEGGTVRMLYAPCPDQHCVRQSKISAGDPPIVCLPERLVVRIVDDSRPIDAVSGGAL